jgi:hypothetical protein
VPTQQVNDATRLALRAEVEKLPQELLESKLRHVRSQKKVTL